MKEVKHLKLTTFFVTVSKDHRHSKWRSKTMPEKIMNLDRNKSAKNHENTKHPKHMYRYR